MGIRGVFGCVRYGRGDVKAPPHGNTYQEDVCAPTMVSGNGWGGPCRGEVKLGLFKLKDQESPETGKSYKIIHKVEKPLLYERVRNLNDTPTCMSITEPSVIPS